MILIYAPHKPILLIALSVPRGTIRTLKAINKDSHLVQSKQDLRP